MEHDPSTTADPRDRAPDHRARRRLVVLLAVLVAIATFVSSVAVWSRSVLLDTDAWVASVGPLAEDPDVTRALATYLVDQAIVAVDLEALAADVLPGRSAALAAPLTASLRTFLTEQADQLLQTERFSTLWVEGNRTAHRTAVRLLRGEPGVVASTDGTVTLNLIPALTWLLERVEQTGLLPVDLEIPPIDRTTPPSDAIAELSAALGRPLPTDFAQIQVFDSSALAQAQDAVALFERLVTVMVISTAVLAGACLVLSLDRRRTVVVLALAISAALLASGAVITAAGDYALRVITDDVDRSAAAAVVRQIIGSLQQIQQLIALAGVLIAAAAFVAGPSERAARLRASLSPRSRRAARATAAGAGPAWASWAARHRELLQVAVLVAAMAAVAVMDPTFAKLGWLAAALVGAQLLLAVVGRRPALDPVESKNQS